METSDRKDVASGLLLLLLGTVVVFISLTEYRLGTLERMGPGFFPAIVGGLLAVLGLIIAVIPLWKGGAGTGALPAVHWRPFLVIIATIIVFSIAIEYLGMIPAVVLVTFVSSFAHPGMQLVQTIVSAVILSGTAALLFRGLLNIPFDLIKWPVL